LLNKSMEPMNNAKLLIGGETVGAGTGATFERKSPITGALVVADVVLNAEADAANGRAVELELTVAEGRHRIVRRMAESLGLKVEWLHRVSYGPVRLGRLAEARYRALTPVEIRAIDRLGADDGQATGRRARIER